MSRKLGVRQRGGDSQYLGSFYASTVQGGPAAISAATLAGINDAPMFHPLSTTATIPGVSSGIVPSGLYLAGLGSAGASGAEQSGGGRGRSIQSLRSLCNRHGMSCRTQRGGFVSRSALIQKLRKARAL